MLRQSRHELIDLLHVQRIAVELIEKDRVVEDADDLGRRRVPDHLRAIGFLARPGVTRGDGNDVSRAEVNCRRQWRRQPDAAIAIPCAVDLDCREEERQRC